jgi:hypothetical protein
MTSLDCSAALDVPGEPPRAVCSLVERVETVETSLMGLRKDFRSAAWRLSVLVGAVSAISPHLVRFGEWAITHLPPPSSVVSLLF